MSGFNFDPTAFIKAPQLAEQRPALAMPEDWADALDRIRARAVPRIATKVRWEQIVADAERIVTLYRDQVIAAGWSAENLFGFDPDEPNGFMGLAVVMRGAELVRITLEDAALKVGNVYKIHRPRMPDGCPMLWNFDDGRGSR